MATIRVIRARECVAWCKDYQIFIDGQLAGAVGYGETKEFPTTAGQHTVTAKIDWCSSPDISIDMSANETKSLTVRAFKYVNWFVAIWFVVFLLFVILLLRTREFLPLAWYFNILMIPFALILVYYFTIGKEKFLRLIVK